MNERNEGFDEMLNDSQSVVSIGYLDFWPADILFHCDPVAYQMGAMEYEDMMEEEEN